MRNLSYLIEDDSKRNRKLVAHAARLLGVSEYELFCVAYQHWFAAPPTEVTLEKVFVRFLFSGEPPGWAKRFAEKTVDEALRKDPPRRLASDLASWLTCVVSAWWLRRRNGAELDSFCA